MQYPSHRRAETLIILCEVIAVLSLLGTLLGIVIGILITSLTLALSVFISGGVSTVAFFVLAEVLNLQVESLESNSDLLAYIKNLGPSQSPVSP